MGFWARLFGRTEHDTTVTDFQARADHGGAFRMPVEDVFTITGRGVVITGTVQSGSVAVGSPVRITNPDGTSIDTTITGVEMFRRTTTAAHAGDNAGLLLGAEGTVAPQRGGFVSRLDA